MNTTIKRAIVSVTDKSGLDSFARALAGRGVALVASGGTAAAIRKAGLAVTEVSDVTGFPEIMDGRVKTLHPKVHGGILCDRGNESHLAQAAANGISLIDLIVVNLYRFSEAAANPKLDERAIVEEIDIGGPSLIRAAAKNYHSVAVVVDPDDYEAFIALMDANGGAIPIEERRRLAAKAFYQTAAYDAAISEYFEKSLAAPADLPARRVAAYRKLFPLRYGENPHLRAALYAAEAASGGLASIARLQGKELSYNNIQDLYNAFLLGRDLGRSSCAIIKHMNPCGAACCDSVLASLRRAWKTDPVSAYGGVIAANETVGGDFAEELADRFVEVIVAREFTAMARASFSRRKNLRLVEIPGAEWEKPNIRFVTRELGELLLVQDSDEGFPELENWRIVTARKPSPSEESALKLSWKLAKHVRSNAIVICDFEGSIGVGAGQMSRVDSCRIAVDKVRREGLTIEGASAASDAFFPFPDGVEVLAEAGVRSIIQPGGSIRDQEVIAAADSLGIAMAFTGRRHFRH